MKKILMVIALVGTSAIVLQSCSKQKGCNDEKACNFDSAAEEDDGSCTYGTNWYQDADGDGLGNPDVMAENCTQPDGYVDNDNDGFDVVIRNKQRATITYVGATWCPPCGNNGDPAKVYMEDTHGSDVVLLSVQSGDAISSSSAFGPGFGSAFQTFVGSTGIPHVYFSGFNFSMVHRGFYSSASSNNSAADTDINNVLAQTAEVGVAAKATKSGSTITVKTAAKFYTANSTEHHIGVYLLEDGVMEQQSGPGTITEHNNIIRGAAYTGNALGIESMGASFTASQTVSGTYTITIPSAVVNNSNLEVAVVVWEGTTADKISNSVKVSVN